MGSKSEQKIEAVLELAILEIETIGNCQHGRPTFITNRYGNPIALRAGSKPLRKMFYQIAGSLGFRLSRRQIESVETALCDIAFASDVTLQVSLRVANLSNGSVEIYLADPERHVVRLHEGEVTILKEGAQAVFEEPATMKPLPMPSGDGDYKLFLKYMNMSNRCKSLLISWITYTLSLGKIPSSNYVLLAITGLMGSGKTSLIKMILDVVDASTIGTQLFPKSSKDLITTSQNLHLASFDNTRFISKSDSDVLAICCTGGFSSTRELYTNSGVHTNHLHLGLIVNSIHQAVTEQDLIDRSLPIEMHPMEQSARRSEKQLIAEFQAELPELYMGLLKLTAKIKAELPNATITSPERMIDFVHWLAAMENVVENSGDLQGYYSELLSNSQLETLLENPLFSAVIDLCEKNKDKVYESTPSKLLAQLTWDASSTDLRSPDWPKSASSLSKKLTSLIPALLEQSVIVELSRGKERKITLMHTELY